MSDKRNIRLRLYADGRLMISLHQFKPFTSSSTSSSKKQTRMLVTENNYMTTKSYSKSLKHAHVKLWNKNYKQEYCRFITLTIRDKLDIKELQIQFRRFLVNIKNHFGNVEYIRVFEMHKDSSRLHIHCIMQFEEMPKRINNPLVEKLWNLGMCNVKKVTDIRGLLQYFTKVKDNDLQKENLSYTYFPKSTKVLTSSQNFGTPVDKSTYSEEYISSERLNQILEFYLKDCKDNNHYVRIDSHNFFDANTQNICNCTDRIFIRSTEELAINNLEGERK